MVRILASSPSKLMYSRLTFWSIVRYGVPKFPYEYTARARSSTSSEAILELYPLRLRLYNDLNIPNSPRPLPTYFSLSRTATIADILKKVTLPSNSSTEDSPSTSASVQEGTAARYMIDLLRITFSSEDINEPWKNASPLAVLQDIKGTTTSLYNSPNGPYERWSTFTPATELDDALLEMHDSLVAIITDTLAPSPGSTSIFEPPSLDVPKPPPAPAPPSSGIRIFDRKNDYFKNLSDSAGLKSSSDPSTSTALTLTNKDKDENYNRSSGFGSNKVGRMRGTVGLTNL